MPIEFPPVVELPVKSSHLTKKLTTSERMVHIMLDTIQWQDYAISVVGEDKCKIPYCVLAKQGVKRMYRIPGVLQYTDGLRKLNELPDKERKVYLINDLEFVSSELLLPDYREKEIK